MYLVVFQTKCMIEISSWNIQQYVQAESFLLPLVRHHSYKNQQYAIQGCNTLSRKCTTYSWRIQSFFCSIQPTTHYLLWKGQQLCRACNKYFKHVFVFLHFHKGTIHNSLQKTGLFSRCMIFSKKNLFKIQQSFHEVHVSSFSCAFMHKMYCFPASVLPFFNKESLLRQNIDDAWKRSRFNCS